MADGISDFKVVTDGLSVWIPVVSALTGGVLAGSVALLVSWQNHRYAREREEKSAADRLRHEQKVTEEKKEKELLFIATELVFILEQFAEGCARVATDTGHTDAQDYTRSNEISPEIDLSVVAGDWRVLSSRLMYAIREIPVLQKGADRLISATEENDDPPAYSRTFRERQYQYARLGLRAMIQARRLRKEADLSATRLDATEWSAQPVLWNVWRQQRKWRAQWSILNKRQLAVFHIVNQMRAGKNDSAPSGEPS